MIGKELQESDLEYIHKFLKEKSIIIPEEYKDVFSNHVNVLIRRLKENQCAELQDLSILDQISVSSFELSEEMLEPLFKKYSVKPNKAEQALMAIYIEMSRKGGTV